ncbi:phosphoglucomutase/phosphomannomutase PgmG [Paremcibacter congregatus]|uniref:Phosphomannomutase n=1 Tax=Paremcibacter congregatus TaxID=2043170 RepID=A0A2G4YMW5_9PROT|nr:phosphomannomutase [Paremcibacter congregatus]QDE27363.1 phosphomannomutase/phosphoglucomutase [Paremcibacter congregatus]
MTQHHFDPSILRAYDIRGRFGDTLNVRDADYLGRSFGTRVLRAGGQKVTVCRDGRLSSPELTEALIAGLRSTGIDVIDIGCGPTPLLYYSVFSLEADGGIMVTGSHNPIEDNGFKLLLGKNALHGAQITALGELAAHGDFRHGQGKYQNIDLRGRYLNRLLQDVDLKLLAEKGFKIGWDPGHGAAAEMVTRLVERLPGTHYVINGEIDGTFPAHHPDPTIPENLMQLQTLVQEKKLDLGFAFDGDGDRIGVVDREGGIIWGDHIISLLAEDILQRTPGATIIADVKSSQVTFNRIAELGGKPLMWKTGHSLIKEKMRETGALLGGELSGHIYIKDQFYGYDDAIYVALRLLNVFAGHKTNMQVLLAAYPHQVSTPEIRLFCEEKRKFIIIEEVLSRLNSTTHEVSTIDGMRVTSEQGWWLLRPSNTQAALVVRCEAASPDKLNLVIAHLNYHLGLSGLAPIVHSI